jgi:hypothetical protein
MAVRPRGDFSFIAALDSSSTFSRLGKVLCHRNSSVRHLAWIDSTTETDLQLEP